MIRKLSSFLNVMVLFLMTTMVPAFAQRPEYEPAYVDGKTVTINVVFFNQLHAPPQAQADFFLVVYPIGFQDLGLAPPICNPCDHGGDGIDPGDFHDHVLDSMPADPGHGEYRPLWHLYSVQPAYTGDTVHDLLVTLAYAAQLPAKSEEDVETLLSSTLPDGSPIAVKTDTNFYFLCSVVNEHAGR